MVTDDEHYMITWVQHVYPGMDYRDRGEKQRERIRKAFAESRQPYRILTMQAENERISLERLAWDAMKNGSRYYAYVHLKGLMHAGDPCVEDWREMLEYFTIDCWRRMKEELDSGTDIVGCNLQSEPAPHFAGNFFWIRHDVPFHLKPPNMLDSPEFWIGSARKKLDIKSVHDSKINHYQERYPPERYR